MFFFVALKHDLNSPCQDITEIIFVKNAPRLRGIEPQFDSFCLFYSPKPRSQVRIYKFKNLILEYGIGLFCATTQMTAA